MVMRGIPLFPGDSEIDQIFKIFRSVVISLSLSFDDVVCCCAPARRATHVFVVFFYGRQVVDHLIRIFFFVIS
jgi:hypothetical protein